MYYVPQNLLIAINILCIFEFRTKLKKSATVLASLSSPWKHKVLSDIFEAVTYSHIFLVLQGSNCEPISTLKAHTRTNQVLPLCQTAQ